MNIFLILVSTRNGGSYDWFNSGDIDVFLEASGASLDFYDDWYFGGTTTAGNFII